MKRPNLTGNAADEKQVKAAERLERKRAERFDASLRAVMATREGRAVMWGLLERAGVYRSVFDLSGSKTFYNAGRQDFGHELLALLMDVNEGEPYLLMEREMRSLAKGDDRETAAVQTAAAEEDKGNA